MTDYADAVNHAYNTGELTTRIFEALEKAGVDIDNLTVDALGPVEELHIGGREHTLELARKVGLTEGTQVIDIGCGVGGPARALANHFGCHVTGIDLTKGFCSVGRMLTERTGLTQKVEIRHADALNLPFEKDTFDLAWMQHTAPNVPDKAQLFREIARVLRPSGKIALYELVSGSQPVTHFPVPWARDATLSFLVTEGEFCDYLDSAGLVPEFWEDITQETTAFLSRILGKARGHGPQRLNPGVILGQEYPIMMQNVLRNLKQDRLRVIRGVLTLAS